MDRPPCAEAAVGAEDICLAPRFDEGVAGPGQQVGDPCQKRQVQVTDLQLVGENALPYLRCRQSAARILLVQDPDGGIVQYLVALPDRAIGKIELLTDRKSTRLNSSH